MFKNTETSKYTRPKSREISKFGNTAFNTPSDEYSYFVFKSVYYITNAAKTTAKYSSSFPLYFYELQQHRGNAI